MHEEASVSSSLLRVYSSSLILALTLFASRGSDPEKAVFLSPPSGSSEPLCLGAQPFFAQFCPRGAWLLEWASPEQRGAAVGCVLLRQQP